MVLAQIWLHGPYLAAAEIESEDDLSDYEFAEYGVILGIGVLRWWLWLWVWGGRGSAFSPVADADVSWGRVQKCKLLSFRKQNPMTIQTLGETDLLHPTACFCFNHNIQVFQVISFKKNTHKQYSLIEFSGNFDQNPMNGFGEKWRRVRQWAQCSNFFWKKKSLWLGFLRFRFENNST